MCGIAGFLSTKTSLIKKAEETLKSMTDAIIHRGPDGCGVWSDKESGVGLGHRRLSIVDLSESGDQPMHSFSGRYVLSYNGEIYNFRDLKKECEKEEKISWNGHSDTEVLLTCIELWGLEKTLTKTVGMFALALWDKKRRVLSLVRDRLGEKPLYCSLNHNYLVFGSELTALKKYPDLKLNISRQGLSLLLKFGYIPAPNSIYENVSKLMPGQVHEFHFANNRVEQREVYSYWDIKEVIEKGINNPFSGSASEAVDLLEATLKESVKNQMISDVPLGAFLSGGIDSSSIVSLMQSQSSRAVKTFSIGFLNKHFNEAEHAKKVASHLGCDHTELYVSDEDVLDLVPKVSRYYSEPFADSSQIPTFLVSEMAKKHVTVSLSGDGGDELFGGYHRYKLAGDWLAKMQKIPSPLRSIAGKGLEAIPNLGSKSKKLAQMLKSGSQEDYYENTISFWNENDIVKNPEQIHHYFNQKQRWPSTDHFYHWMMAADTQTYLPDDILCKVDRAAMSVSLETRVPLLDHRVFEFAWSLPLELKVKEGISKWPLKEVLYRHVPKEIIDRPKKGFSVPLGEWLRGPLREWASDLLAPERIEKEGFLDSDVVSRVWLAHQNRERDFSHQLWCLLSFQSWLEEQG